AGVVTPRGHLFRKYVIIIAGLVSGALLASGAIEIYFSYYENREALVALQREKAIGVAARIEAYIKEIEQQISWTTQPQLGPATPSSSTARACSSRIRTSAWSSRRRPSPTSSRSRRRCPPARPPARRALKSRSRETSKTAGS